MLRGPALVARDTLDKRLDQKDGDSVLMEDWRGVCIVLDRLSKSPEREARRKAMELAIKTQVLCGEILVAGGFVQRVEQ